ncbi:CLUMA_CG011511, isoform A [Clunio marinus]|uniref:CLUMA_CG011511, isoform A n=1 Tax=Clunio marinus TaxID=568069 RepID=A0A1J1ICY6_9DIPT|nr:CLUMA_CG011511, isoform A [Clunio marinus]
MEILDDDNFPRGFPQGDSRGNFFRIPFTHVIINQSLIKSHKKLFKHRKTPFLTVSFTQSENQNKFERARNNIFEIKTLNIALKEEESDTK